MSLFYNCFLFAKISSISNCFIVFSEHSVVIWLVVRIINAFLLLICKFERSLRQRWPSIFELASTLLEMLRVFLDDLILHYLVVVETLQQLLILLHSCRRLWYFPVVSRFFCVWLWDWIVRPGVARLVRYDLLDMLDFPIEQSEVLQVLYLFQFSIF